MTRNGPFDGRPMWRRRVRGGGLVAAVLLSLLAWLPFIAGLHLLWRWMQ